MEETSSPGPPAHSGCAWIDGQYVPISEARIPILDAGFLWSYLTYDVVGVWEGSFFRLDDHLDRLEAGCRKIRLEPPLPREQVRQILIELVRRSALQSAYVEVIVSRGIPSPGDRDPRRPTPRLYAYAIPYMWIVPPDTETDVVIARDVQRIPPGAIDPTVKNFQWGDFVRGIFEAYDRGARLPILTDRDGNVTEGPGFNVFAVADGALHTPEHGVLLGITRKTVLEIAAEQNLAAHVGEVKTSLLDRAEEIFLTSTAGGVMPVATLDGRPVGAKCPGPITTQIRDLYWAWHRDPRFVTPIDYGD